MRGRILAAGLGLALAVAACGKPPEVPRADSSPDQAGTPVPPPAGVTPVYDTAEAPGIPGEGGVAKPAATPTGVTPPRPAGSLPAPGGTAKAPAGKDTLERDRAIEYVPNPRNELPAVGEPRPKRP